MCALVRRDFVLVLDRERDLVEAVQEPPPRRLVELDRHVPVEEPLDLAAVEDPDPNALLEFLRARGVRVFSPPAAMGQLVSRLGCTVTSTSRSSMA